MLNVSEKIKHFYTEELLTAQQIAGLFGLTPYEVTQTLLRMGVELRPIWWKPEPRELHAKHPAWCSTHEIARLYTEECIPSPRIAEIYSCGSRVVLRILKSAGVKVRSRKDPGNSV